MPDNLSVNNLKANLTNPQRTYMWNVLIPYAVGGGDSDTLTLRAQSAEIPGRSVGQIPVPYKQSGGLRFHGKLTYSHTWDVTFVEGEDRRVFDTLYAWKQNIVHDIANVGAGDIAIKADIILQLITTKGEESMRIKLVGAFPMAVGDVALSYETEAIVNYTVTWSYDSWVRV